MANWRSNWRGAEESWDARAKILDSEQPIKKLKVLPDMVGITPETANNLKWKSLKWMVLKDRGLHILKGFLRHPFKYGWSLIKSLIQSKPYKRDGDLFLYGIDSISRFKEKIEDPNSILILGFSYCHKPFECPSGRFTPNCIHDPNHPVCGQCFIGKAVNASVGAKVIPLFIPTILRSPWHVFCISLAV
jgi:hypothetical protein